MPATASRGVEAKEDELADTVLDEHSLGGSVARASSTHTHTVDETNSYIQVVVQKQRRERGVRLPAASSPAPAPRKLQQAEAERREEAGGECGEGAPLLLLPTRPPLLLLSPLTFAAMARSPPAPHNECVRKEFTRSEERAAGGGDAQPRASAPRKPKCKASWGLLGLDDENLETSDYDPEGFEVYYLESAEAAHLVTRTRPARVTRCVRRARRRAGALLRELLAAASLLPAAPLALLLAVLRCGLEVCCVAASGAVQAVSDGALKPALAALHNGVLQPPLVCAAGAARGVRAALRPVSAALNDALEPLARVLSALRLVHVHIERAPCACARHSADGLHA